MNELEQSLIIKVSNGNIREAQKAAKAVLAATTLKKDKWFCERSQAAEHDPGLQ